ncbi:MULTISPECIES: hypothetical protein [Asaia]|uniref:Lipoprotein n=2 Tax=Asaia bogorensis TaxID=91915 RepID=A0AAN4R318_9PROT|nr:MULTISPECIES: hypothetical protein [Asaia]ETC98603.1 hypothetical protein P792_08660 [Asaia sp. SF2.1]MDL2172013.1 hypothetical protein [Asaia sp. HumB]CDG39183.1 hypothetical protein ASAP_1138 [Asaia bogorensis]BAT19278.1 hypothetical protein Asbog_00990 [Asaia bogorensis NBRC 16594]GBQ82348.1 hypothetical protein AA0311_2870 [Asaia bogorensis NBRC 16594]
MTRYARQFLPLLAILGTGTALTACDQDDQSAFAPVCPPVEILSSAADYYQYDGHGLDAGSLVTHAAMSGLTGNCEGAPKKTVRSRLSLGITVERGPASDGKDIVLPYFVAVMRDGKIIDKKEFEVPVSFAGNQSTVSLRTPVRIIDVPASPDLQLTNYSLKIGFQLSREQLDYNQTHLRPAKFTAHTN